MAISYGVIQNGSIVLQYWTGSVTRDDIIVQQHDCLSDPRIKPNTSVLIDATETLFGLTPEKMRDIVNVLFSTALHSPTIKNFVLLVNPLTYRLAHVQEATAHLYGTPVRAFTSLHEACACLELDTKMVTSQLERIRHAGPAPTPDT